MMVESTASAISTGSKFKKEEKISRKQKHPAVILSALSPHLNPHTTCIKET
jgi:hypothetical protein